MVAYSGRGCEQGRAVVDGTVIYTSRAEKIQEYRAVWFEPV
jgi:hypothetical protein